MDLNIEIKIKMKNKEVVLNNDEAKELYFKLKEIYDKDKEVVTFPIYTHPPYPPYYREPFIWMSSGTNYTIENKI